MNGQPDTDDCYFPIVEAEKLVDGFLTCTLPASEWTHEVHLLVGLKVWAEHGEGALAVMRRHLIAYNESVGKANDDHSGYHETLTFFWLKMIGVYCRDAAGSISWTQQSVDDLLWEEELADRNLWLKYYSVPLIKSVMARRHVVSPDVSLLPA